MDVDVVCEVVRGQTTNNAAEELECACMYNCACVSVCGNAGQEKGLHDMWRI